MTDAIASPSPVTVLRRFAVQVWHDPDARSSAIGVAGVLLVYLLMWAIGPRLMRVQPTPLTLHPHSVARQFNIELSRPPVPRPLPKPPTPKQFVETNPDAPENIPDKTNNFAAQNQQVAQEKPTPNGTSERPATEGKKDFQSNQIVTGRLQKEVEPFETAPAQPTPPQPQTSAAPRAEQNPLPGFEKMQGSDANAFGANIANPSANPRPIPQKIEGAKDVPLIEGATESQPAIDPKHPRSRPALVKQQQVRPAILAQNNFGTQNVGIIAINAKFSQYGLYLHRLADAVQIAWEDYLNKSAIYPTSGSYVIVKFVLNSKGEIVRFEDVENHSTDLGAQACTAAITNRAPYGDWTDDMKATLNPDGEELVFTFYYE
jgi:hypothetical protein